MGVLWLLFVVLAADALELTVEQYHQMPQLFQLDNYEVCLSQRSGAFCLGTFDLAASSNNRLFKVLQKYSEDRVNFNHTRIHRGYCVNTRCSHISGVSINRRFVKCVNNITKNYYGLEAKLAHLDYCKTSKTPPSKPIDGLDVAFAYICGGILLMNIIGTLYDFVRNADHKPKRYLLAWSLAENWRRLTDSYENGDKRIKALEPIHGMKALTLILVMMAHTVIIYHTGYILNPQFLENGNRNPLSTYLHNGSLIVQTFIMLSSFLLVYNLLIYLENNPKKELNMKLLPSVLLNRFSRITPLYAFIIGLATTWWRHSSDGPLWSPLVEAECLNCRRKWWAQLLYINNMVMQDVTCLIQTWFLAVDMQLYVVAALLTLNLGRSLTRAIKLLTFMFISTIVFNFALAYYWDLKPIVFITTPEVTRKCYLGEPSFDWLYVMPWASLPSSLLGLLAGFLLYHWQQNNINPQDSLVFRTLYRCSVPLMFATVLSGYFLKEYESRAFAAACAALDRPLFTLFVTIAFFGFIHKVDSLWWRFLSWSGWRPLSRMSLSVLLVHLFFNYIQVAVKTDLMRTSVYEMSGHWLVTIFMTYHSALVLHLFVEQPLHQFLKSLLS